MARRNWSAPARPLHCLPGMSLYWRQMTRWCTIGTLTWIKELQSIFPPMAKGKGVLVLLESYLYFIKYSLQNILPFPSSHALFSPSKSVLFLMPHSHPLTEVSWSSSASTGVLSRPPCPQFLSIIQQILVFSPTAHLLLLFLSLLQPRDPLMK